MKELEKFNFNGFELTVIGDDKVNNPLFIAADVCEFLGLNNVSKAIASLDDDEKLTLPIVRSGQSRDMAVINESGLYSLIFKSRKDEAKAFRKWVTSEVLPSIRKTGMYQMQNRISALEQVVTPAQADLSLMIGLVGDRLDSIYNFSAPLKQWKERAVIDIFWTVFPSKESYKVSLEKSLALIKKELKKRGCKFLHNNYYVITPPKNNL